MCVGECVQTRDRMWYLIFYCPLALNSIELLHFNTLSPEMAEDDCYYIWERFLCVSDSPLYISPALSSMVIKSEKGRK